ncbi:MAG: tRNA lysidine(34) synthetase TilS [Bacteroidia bacterium]|nr:tRNA lysidine(34) synthetase TilS [Bacteroidia bacterium]
MKVLLAVSGGIDSMCMADMYSHTEQEYAVAHCNFHLRDKDSDADAELVREWAESHGVRYFQADFDTEGYASEHGISIEMAARELRYGWFRKIAETECFDAVAVAHNANDNAETLILNLLRGTGSRGLRGMEPTTGLPAGKCPANRLTAFGPSHKWAPPSYVAEGGTGYPGTSSPEGSAVLLLRPLLGMSRAEIEAYAQEHGVRYREDRTNKETVYKRNRIRNNVFPEFKKINPSYIRTLNEDIARIREVDDIAEEWYLANAGKVFDGTSIDIKSLLSLKHRKYMLFRLLEPYWFNASVLDSIYAFLDDIAEGKELTISGKRFFSDSYMLETSTDRITILPAKSGADSSEVLEIAAAGTYSFSGRTVIVEDMPYTEGMSLKPEKGALLCDADALGYPFTVRHWNAGDWMRPFGMGGKAKKISDLFTDLKFTLAEKETAAMLFSPALSGGDTSHIAAVAGYRMDEALRISKGSKRIIKVSIL